MSTKNKELPKWYDGGKYTEGDTVTNPFSGESYELTGVELSLYDFIIGCQMMFDTQPSIMTSKRVDEFQKALMWFRKNNPEAYYVLLD